MGAAGSDVALETADVALMGDDLGQLPFAVGLGRRASRVIRQNLFASLGIVVVLLVATITGLAGIGPAVVLHEGSTLLVVANALRLLGYRRSSRPTTPDRAGCSALGATQYDWQAGTPLVLDRFEEVRAMADDFTLHPPVARWTHIAVPCSDIDAMIDWYTALHPARTARPA